MWDASWFSHLCCLAGMSCENSFFSSTESSEFCPLARIPHPPLLYCLVPRIELKVSYLQGKSSTTKLYLQPISRFFFLIWDRSLLNYRGKPWPGDPPASAFWGNRITILAQQTWSGILLLSTYMEFSVSSKWKPTTPFQSSWEAWNLCYPSNPGAIDSTWASPALCARVNSKCWERMEFTGRTGELFVRAGHT